MAIQIGSLVRVSFKKKTDKDPAKKFNGQTFVVKSRRSIHQSDTDVRWLYELYGAKTKHGMPYTFIEENLEVVEEGEG